MASPVDRFTERDIATLAALAGLTAEEIRESARSRPWKIAELLSSDEVFDGVMDRHTHPLAAVSPNLLFSVLIHRAASHLRTAPYLDEWVGVGARLPVYDVEGVHDFLTDSARLMFLTDLLCAFVDPPSLPMPLEDPLDLAAIAMWLDVVGDDHRVTLLKRMGDVALFLAGVFPDRTGSRPIEPVVAESLGRTVGLSSDEVLSLCEASGMAGLDAYERLGSEWYGAASELTTSPLVADVARRFPSARRVLNHVADRFLFRLVDPSPA